jgi:hypothetical protein
LLWSNFMCWGDCGDHRIRHEYAYGGFSAGNPSYPRRVSLRIWEGSRRATLPKLSPSSTGERLFKPQRQPEEVGGPDQRVRYGKTMGSLLSWGPRGRQWLDVPVGHTVYSSMVGFCPGRQEGQDLGTSFKTAQKSGIGAVNAHALEGVWDRGALAAPQSRRVSLRLFWGGNLRFIDPWFTLPTLSSQFHRGTPLQAARRRGSGRPVPAGSVR